jgi:hypothetical protein
LPDVCEEGQDLVGELVRYESGARMTAAKVSFFLTLRDACANLNRHLNIHFSATRLGRFVIEQLIHSQRHGNYRMHPDSKYLHQDIIGLQYILSKGSAAKFNTSPTSCWQEVLLFMLLHNIIKSGIMRGSSDRIHATVHDHIPGPRHVRNQRVIELAGRALHYHQVVRHML